MQDENFELRMESFVGAFLLGDNLHRRTNESKRDYSSFSLPRLCRLIETGIQKETKTPSNVVC